MSAGKIFLLQQYNTRNRTTAAAATPQGSEPPPKARRGGSFILATSMSASTSASAAATANQDPGGTQSPSLTRWPTVFQSVHEDITVDDWEEKGEDTSMAVHMVAGSFAGLIEHVALFPIDTIRTHAQSTRSGASVVDLLSKRGLAFLWRGATALAWAVVPAHAALFSTYETIMDLGLPGRNSNHSVPNNNIPMDAPGSVSNRDYRNSSVAPQEPQPNSYSGQRVAMVGFLAGSVSGLVHDLIMVPAETVKQRLQLGYYQNASHAIRRMAQNGGHSFYRSLPTTLAMSVPYSSLMMASNETIRWYLNPSGSYSLPTFLLAGAVSGSFAAAATTPLDVIKTKLNTQGLTMAKTSTGELNAAPREFKVRYKGFVDAYSSIARSSGVKGFFRGVGPRVLQIGPSCALSWCAYETAKKFCTTAWHGGGSS